MKTMTVNTATKLMNQGVLECETDLRPGMVDVRWATTGKRETVKVTE